MQKALLSLVLIASLGALCCKKDEQPPPQQPQPYPPPAPVTAQPTVAQPPPPAPAPAPTVATPAPAPGPAPTGGLSQPSPMALPCTADANCLTHRCNTQFGKCAWPCQTDNDCNPGNRCTAGACLPATQ